MRLVHSVPWVGASPFGDRFVRDPVVGDEVVFLNRHQQLLRGYVSFKLESGNKDGIQYGGHLEVVTVPGEACVSSSISNEAGETKGSTGAECFNFARAGNCIEDHVFFFFKGCTMSVCPGLLGHCVWNALVQATAACQP